MTYANFDTLTLLIQHLTGSWVNDINFAYMIAIACGSALVLIFLIYHITNIEKILTNPIYDLISALDAYKENSDIYNAVKDYVQDRLTSTDESFASSVAAAADTYGSKLAREEEVKESAANWNK